MIDNFQKLAGNEHIKRGLEISSFGRHKITIIDSFDLKKYIEDAYVSIGGNLDNLTVIKPCPCGNLNNPSKMCNCSTARVTKYYYWSVIQEAFKDVHLVLETSAVRYKDIENTGKNYEDANSVLKRMKACMEEISILKINEHSNELLKKAVQMLGFTLNQYDIIVSVARTIARLDDAGETRCEHFSEAIQYQTSDILQGDFIRRCPNV